MILPIKFLWEQLDGPQANAIEQAIYEYWKQMFDGKLDYLNNINIENANDAHLTLLGIIANFIRPNILVPDKDYFLFTEHAESDNPHGLSFVNNRAVGGRLTAISGPEQGPYPLDTEFYRTLLKTYRDSDGEIDSLVLLDDICNALSLKDNPMVQPSYEFSFTKTTTEVTGRGPGDLYIDMGSMSHWANPLQIYAVLTGLANSVFWPLPRIWTSLDTDIRTHTPSPNIQGGTYGEPVTIELSCSTAGASIIYTLDGSEPFQDTGLTYTGPIEITDTTLLRVRAYKAELEPSFEFSAQYIISTNIQLPEVMSSVASGLYTGDMTVELNCPFGLPTVIRYTLDGTEPTESSPEYTEPLATTGNMLLKAKAFRGTSYLPSDTTTYDIRVMPQSIVIGPDIWTQAPLVTLTCATEGVTILYSTDGNAPRTEYTEPFYLYETTTIKAIATKAGYTDSVLSEKVFSITSVQPVQSSLPAGTYQGAQSVILYCDTPNASIHYTLDGTEPNEASPEYSAPITIPIGTTTLKAKAWKGELVPTEVGTWEYTIQRITTQNVQSSLASGSYICPQAVVLSCDTSGAIIRYTTDGTIPDESSTLYENPILLDVEGVVTIKAKAWAADYNPSEVSTWVYTMTDTQSTLVAINEDSGTYTITKGIVNKPTSDANLTLDTISSNLGTLLSTYGLTLSNSKLYKVGSYYYLFVGNTTKSVCLKSSSLQTWEEAFTTIEGIQYVNVLKEGPILGFEYTTSVSGYHVYNTTNDVISDVSSLLSVTEVSYINSQYVAITKPSYDRYVIYTTDNIITGTWSEMSTINLSTDTSRARIVYGPAGYLLTLYAQGAVMHGICKSLDLITWTDISLSGMDTYITCGYGPANSTYYVRGIDINTSTVTVKTSMDLITWTTSSQDPIDSANDLINYDNYSDSWDVFYGIPRSTSLYTVAGDGNYPKYTISINGMAASTNRLLLIE